jgi:hypothetical protein
VLSASGTGSAASVYQRSVASGYGPTMQARPEPNRVVIAAIVSLG